MKKYLVSYDLRNPHRDYGSLIDAIKTADLWCHVLESVWVIWAAKSATQIFTYLSQFTDSDDGLVVLPLSSEKDGEWKGLAPEVSNSLQANW